MDYVYTHRSDFSNLPDQEFLSPECAFQLEGTAVSRDQQDQILSYFKSTAYELEKNDPRNSSYSFWDPLSLRAIEATSVPARYSNQKISQVEYLFRHHFETKWYWREHPLTELVKSIVEPYVSIFDFFTRVKIHIQQPNFRLSFHRDLTAGQTYEITSPLSTEFQSQQFRTYQMYPWVDLKDLPKYPPGGEIQNCFSLKIPLSEDAHHYGLQTVLDGKPYYYTTNGNAYLLNETKYHGSEAVPFQRGLIFVDGIINFQELQKFWRKAIACRPYDYPIVK